MRKLLNIQLFAGDLKTEGKTTTYAGNATVDKAHEFVDRALKESMYEEITLNKYTDNVPLPLNNGDTFTFRKLDKYDAQINELEEGVYPDEDAPMRIFEYKMGVKDYGGFTSYTDKVDIYSLNNGWAARISKNQGNSVGEKMNIKMRDAFYSSPNRWFAGTAVTPSDTLATIRAKVGMFNLDDLRKIGTAFKRMKVKPYAGGDYLMLVSPEVSQSLLTLKKSGDDETYTFVEVSQYTNVKPLFDGEIGRWSGFRIVEDTTLGAITTLEDGTEIHGCLALGKYNGENGVKQIKLDGHGAPKSIIKALGSAGTNDPLNQRGTVGWKMNGWGIGVLYAEAVMVYECKTDMSTASVFEETAREYFSKGTTGVYKADSDGTKVQNADEASATKTTNGALTNGKKGAPIAKQ